MKTCFIAMPISTPEHLLPIYGNDSEHFLHVLEFLFEPAVVTAGMTPIRPISEGSEAIHADIIGHLQVADLVLVDMSTLNANAFFEFGIRTSLNKPVCLVRDEKTQKIPFDAALLNTFSYDSRLDPWHLKPQVPKLAEHLKASLARSNGKNPLWKHFGFKLEASAPESPASADDKMSLLLDEFIALRNAIQTDATKSDSNLSPTRPRMTTTMSSADALMFAKAMAVTFPPVEVSNAIAENGNVVISVSCDVNSAPFFHFSRAAAEFFVQRGWNVSFRKTL